MSDAVSAEAAAPPADLDELTEDDLLGEPLSDGSQSGISGSREAVSTAAPPADLNELAEADFLAEPFSDGSQSGISESRLNAPPAAS